MVQALAIGRLDPPMSHEAIVALSASLDEVADDKAADPKGDDLAKGEVYYNYELRKLQSEEMSGISVFYKDPGGTIFHTYSCYARGLDMLNVAYHYLDLTPKERDEEELPFPMAWVRYHDAYGK